METYYLHTVISEVADGEHFIFALQSLQACKAYLIQTYFFYIKNPPQTRVNVFCTSL